MASLPPIANNADIRLLGAMLGDVIRGYAGDAVYEKVEAIRRAAVERARAQAGDEPALPALDLDDSVAVVRAFMLFSMLANLAEDRQGVAVEEGATLEAALARLQAEGIATAAVRALLDRAFVVPVLTAHPTEVRRKSMIDHRNRIAALLALRDDADGAGDTETADGDMIDDAIRRQIALLWQTRALRRERLGVIDEVETALSYLRDVFMPALPALYQRWDRALHERTPSFLRPGSWIGGDRDGNPFGHRRQPAHCARPRGGSGARPLLRRRPRARRRIVDRQRPGAGRPRRRGPSPTPRATPPPAARTNPIAVRCRGSMPASPPPIWR